jgi:peptidyl-prolyl cis-trans isomerase A (cyclophilin A)
MMLYHTSTAARIFNYALLFAGLAVSGFARADETSARAAMENNQNPLVQITTTEGNIYLELLAAEAPQNVANFLALAAGEVQIFDADSGQLFSPNYYDGMTFHRIVPDFLIQAGSPQVNVFGAPAETVDDEINAAALGLDRMPAVLTDGSFNPILQIGDREELEEVILIPLYRAMNISSNAQVTQRQFEVDERLRSMSVQDVYENLGYRYTERFITRPIGRGTVALANAGPDSNGPEFFIAVNQAEWLNGRYTVIGRVVEGMDVVDRISQTPTDQSRGAGRALIYRIREL